MVTCHVLTVSPSAAISVTLEMTCMAVTNFYGEAYWWVVLFTCIDRYSRLCKGIIFTSNARNFLLDLLAWCFLMC